MKNPPSRRLTRRRSIVPTFFIGISFVVILLSVAIAVTMTDAQSGGRAAAQWIDGLDLSVPAFWASGTPLRNPFATVKAVDLRHAPWLPMRALPDVGAYCTPGANATEAGP